jgi:hypothetical protein
VIALLEPFDLEIVVADPHLSPAEAEALGVTLVDLPTLLRTCAIVSVHAPELPSTHHLLGATELALVQDGATWSTRLAGAWSTRRRSSSSWPRGGSRRCLDVTDPEPLPGDHPLLSLPNAFVTPHVAARSAPSSGGSPRPPCRRSSATPPGSRHATRCAAPTWSASRDGPPDPTTRRS